MTKLKKWELLEETDVSPSKWFPLYKHKVKLPNGKIVDDFYVSKLGDVVMIVPVTKNNELVFVRQYKHGAGDIVLEFPAGRVGNDAKELAAERELKEETGYIANRLEYLGVSHSTPTKDTAKIDGFLARGLEAQVAQELDENEEIEVVKVPISEVDDLVKNGGIAASDTLAFLYLAKLHAPELFE